MYCALQHTVIAGQDDSQPYYLQYKQCLLGDQNDQIIQKKTLASRTTGRAG